MNTTTNNIDFSNWALQTYNTKKDAVELLEKSNDPFEKAIGIIIKKYASLNHQKNYAQNKSITTTIPIKKPKSDFDFLDGDL